jgi:hypothetical protein
VEIVFENDFLVIPHIERQLEGPHAAIIKRLPDVSLVKPLQIFEPRVVHAIVPVPEEF